MVDLSNNKVLYDKSNSIILNLETLRTTYKNLLIEYQQAVANYVSYLKQDPSSNSMVTKYVTINGQQFLGGGALSQNNSATLNDCIASCSSNPQCTGATYNPTNYKQPMCFLRKGDGNLVKGLSSDIAIVPKGKQLLSIVQNINQQLNETNTKIQQLAKQAQPTYKELNQKKESENEILMKQYAQLTAERVKIDKMLDEYETLDKTQNQGTIQTNKNYYVYILLCLFAILIVFLLVKFVASSSQQNQGSMYQSGGGFFY
jgi:hypothetical protein